MGMGELVEKMWRIENHGENSFSFLKHTSERKKDSVISNECNSNAKKKRNSMSSVTRVMAESVGEDVTYFKCKTFGARLNDL